MKSNKTMSYLGLIASMLIFGTIGIFRRNIPLSSAMLACVRGVLGSLFLGVILLTRKRGAHGTMPKRDIGLLALTGGLIGLNWMLLFEAYRMTTVAKATLCYYMQPTIVILLSPFLLKEKLTPRRAICAAVAVVGMVLVSGVIGGEAGANDLKGIALGLGAAALYASVVILNKRIGLQDAFMRTLIQLASAAIVLIPYLAVTRDVGTVPSGAAQIALVLIVGIVHTGIAYVLYFGSMGGLKSQSVAVLSYIDPVSAVILSALLLGESMTLAAVIGAVLIIGSALIGELKN